MTATNQNQFDQIRKSVISELTGSANSANKEYYVFYVNNNSIRLVSKKAFKGVKGKFFKFNGDNSYCKVYGLNKRKFCAESIFSDIKDSFTGFKFVADFFRKLGEVVDNNWMIDTVLLSQFVGFLMDVHNLMTNKGAAVFELVKVVMNGYVLFSRLKRGETFLVKARVLQLLNEARGGVIEGNPGYTSMSNLGLGTVFGAESLDSLGIAALTLLLPSKLITVLQRMNMLTSIKILDDKTIFHDLLAGLGSMVESFIDLLPLSQATKISAKSFLDIVRISNKHTLLRKLEILNTRFAGDPKSFLCKDLIPICDKLLQEIDTCDALSDWCRFSRSVEQIVASFRRNCKVLHNNCSSYRVEPACFVFEGPPGCGKSVMMSSIIQSLGMSNYSHVTKSNKDGKDWYDSYNNEQIFYMDDVGQQGASQWRNIINMVAPVRLPLDCAEAKLKDTKFFNSELLLLTTNNLKNLTLMKDDCISHISALHRRCNLFDFSGLRMNPCTGEYKGTVKVEFYSLDRECYVNQFPSFFNKFIREKGIDISPILDVEGKLQSKHIISAWCSDIISIMLAIKKQQLSANELTENDREAIFNLRLFKPETLFGESMFASDGISFKMSPNLNVVVEEEVDWSETEQGELLMFEQRLAALKQSSNPVNVLDTDYLDEEYRSEFQAQSSASVEVSDWFIDLVKGFKDKVLATITKILGVIRPGSSIEDLTSYMNEIIALVCVMFLGVCCWKFLAWLKQYHKINNVTEDDMRLKSDFAHYQNKEPFRAPWRAFINSEIDELELKKQFIENLYVFGGESSFKFENMPPSSVHALSSQIRPITCSYGNNKVQSCLGLMSGHMIVVPSHVCPVDQFYVSVYNDETRSHRVVDNMHVEVVYRNNEADVGVLKFNDKKLSPWKNMAKFFKEDSEVALKPFLVSYKDYVPLSAIKTDRSYCAPYQFNVGGIFNFKGYFDESNYFYNKRGKGMCGSMVFDQDAGLLGMHVAGSEAIGVGVAMRWSLKIRSALREILVQDDKYLIPLTIAEKVREGESVMQFDYDIHQSIPKKSNFVPSPLFGIYPVERAPADLSKYGVGTVKEVAKKSFKMVSEVDDDEINFAMKVIEALVPKYGVLSNTEIVSGDQFLAGLNKKSSNGFGCEKEKAFYIDFLASDFTKTFIEELELLEKNIRNGVDVPIDKLIWFETLKDETRDLSKQGEPRSFRVSTIHLQVLTKKYFGDMVRKLIKNRKFNKIMVGCNPAKDWNDIYLDVLSKGNVFDGDIKWYDGCMNGPLQQAIHKVLWNKSSDKLMAKFILSNTDNILVVIMNSLFMTTHSMPSGSFLTAILNSIINRGYTAMWFYRSGGRSIEDFFNHISDYVYGDDKIVAVSDKYKFLTARSFADFMRSIGLDFTDAHKQVINCDFMEPKDISFLKREFVYHNVLKRIMCPLSLKTLYSGLSWVDSTKDVNVVMEGKISAFQREIYLHPNYLELKQDFISRMSEFDFPFVELPDEYLESLYMDDEYVIPMKLDFYL